MTYNSFVYVLKQTKHLVFGRSLGDGKGPVTAVAIPSSRNGVGVFVSEFLFHFRNRIVNDGDWEIQLANAMDYFKLMEIDRDCVYFPNIPYTEHLMLITNKEE